MFPLSISALTRRVSCEQDVALHKETLANLTAQNHRDQLRTDMNRAHAVYLQRQAQVEKQILEIDKLNTIVNT